MATALAEHCAPAGVRSRRYAVFALRAVLLLTLAGLAYGVATVAPLLFRPLPQLILLLSDEDPDKLRLAHGHGRGIEAKAVAADADGAFALDLAALMRVDHGPVRLRRINAYELMLEAGHEGVQRARYIPFPHNWYQPGRIMAVVTLTHPAAAAPIAAALLAALGAAWWFRRRRYRRLEAGMLDFLGRFGRWEAALVAGAGLFVVTRAVGTDLLTFGVLLDIQHAGINLYQFELQVEALTGRLAQGGLAVWPYTPLASALLVPLADLFRLLGGLSYANLSSIVLAIWLAYVAAVLLALHLFWRHGVLPDDRLRPALWFTLANPFLFYSVALFGQLDIFAVLFLLPALMLLFDQDGNAALAGLSAALATFIKPQHLILLPPLALLLFYWTGHGTWRRALRFAMFLAIGLALSYGLLVGLQKDFTGVLNATVHKDRIWQPFLLFAGGIQLLSLFFAAAVAAMLCAVAWPQDRGTRGHVVMTAVTLTLLVGCYQVAILSTLGLYALMLLGLPLLAAAASGRRLAAFSLLSCAGTASWALTPAGDITRLLSPNGPLTAKLARLRSPDAEHFYSLVATVERAFVVVMMLCVVWAAVKLLRREE